MSFITSSSLIASSPFDILLHHESPNDFKRRDRVYEFFKMFDKYIADQVKDFEKEPSDLTSKFWVKQKLTFMVEIDQYARSQSNIPYENSYSDVEKEFFWQEYTKRLEILDNQNTSDLKWILKKYEWIRISEFGKQADRNAWLIVQHADNHPKFQREIVLVLDKLWRNGETNRINYAYLFDRTAASWSDLSKQRPQRYGTQGMCTGPGVWEPIEIEDSENVDIRRAEVGLGTLQEYIDGFKDICR